MQKYQKQVKEEHYSFNHYFFPGRWMSYYYQTKELVSRDDIKTVLDIGPGTNFFKEILAIHRPDIVYKTLDIDTDLNPDFVGSVTEIPLLDKSYDVVTAFQVLEHIRFEDVEKALSEIHRISRKYVFISLPHFGPSIELLFKLPLFKRHRFSFKLPFHPAHVFEGEHYWEIGKKGYSQKRIRNLFLKYFDIIDEYVPFENQYHHFFIMKKKSDRN